MASRVEDPSLVMALAQSRQDQINTQQSGVISLLQDWFLQTIPGGPCQAELSLLGLVMALAAEVGPGRSVPRTKQGRNRHDAFSTHLLALPAESRSLQA